MLNLLQTDVSLELETDGGAHVSRSMTTKSWRVHDDLYWPAEGHLLFELAREGDEHRMTQLAEAPWVYYVVPDNFRSPMNPVQLSFHGIANSLTFPMPSSPTGRIRLIFGTKQMRTDGALGYSVTSRPARLRIVSMAGSLVMRNTIDKIRLFHDSRNLHTPDLIFVYDVFRRITDIDRFSCPKAYFVGDASISVDRYFELAMVQDYDHVFVAQKDYVPVFKSRGCKNVHWLPYMVDPQLVYGPRLEEKYDFCFVARPYPGTERARLVEFLKKERKELRSFIGTTPNSGELYRQSKIALQKSVGGVLGQRVFEVMGSGAMLLTDRISNGLFDLFKENRHLACYSDTAELVEKIEYFVRHDDERRRVARTGQLEVLTKHTITHRANSILKTCIGRDMNFLASKQFPWFRDDFVQAIGR